MKVQNFNFTKVQLGWKIDSYVALEFKLSVTALEGEVDVCRAYTTPVIPSISRKLGAMHGNSTWPQLRYRPPRNKVASHRIWGLGGASNHPDDSYWSVYMMQPTALYIQRYETQKYW